MVRFQFEYQVKTSDELQSLEKSMHLLLSHYSIRGKGTLIVSRSELDSELNGCDITYIEPKKNSSIEEIFSNSKDGAKGETIKASPQYQYLKIKGDSFFINYNPLK